jgi:hypothetical protein
LLLRYLPAAACKLIEERLVTQYKAMVQQQQQRPWTRLVVPVLPGSDLPAARTEDSWLPGGAHAECVAHMSSTSANCANPQLAGMLLHVQFYVNITVEVEACCCNCCCSHCGADTAAATNPALAEGCHLPCGMRYMLSTHPSSVLTLCFSIGYPLGIISEHSTVKADTFDTDYIVTEHVF